MALYKTLLPSWPAHIGEQDFLLLALLICALIVTYCWCVLGSRLKLALCFSVGVILFKALFDHLIDKRLFPDLHRYLPYVLGSITAGLLEIGAFLLSNRTVIFGIFFSGAICPLFCLTRMSSFDFSGRSFALLSISAAAIVIFCGFAKLKVTRTRLFNMVVSAIAGGFGVVHLISFSVTSSNWPLSGIYGFQVISHTIQNSRFSSAICLAISGLVVQALLHLALRQCAKSEPLKYYADAEKESSKYCQSSTAATNLPIVCSHHVNF